ncbi:efflux RND transporter periplasmic adaptor subunit [Chryseolinea sp. H1M3-3]|uniref:efflux RND transporter periplasmic adaptor subunit n=1 Tax=Chryseolinea sp. H1M3-3 TaxID=3034144 RepID=UPI0023ED212B|nr:efflux RND transporter periplasmic adaptor subunit [Chryseolinea sp. H1M3-3]
MKKNIIITLTFVGALASAVVLQSCTDSKGNATIPKNSEPIPVRVIELQKSVGHQIIKASGQLTTNDETILGFKTSGIVNSILVKEGDFVKKGQLLATLDLREIDAHVAQARFGYEKAQRDFDRVKNLYQDSVATLEQLQDAETGLAVAKEQLAAAGFNRNFSSIYAIGNGYVLRKFVNPGQVVDVGDPIVMTNGAGTAKWILKIGVSDKQWSDINIGDSSTVTIDAFSDRTFEAKVVRKWESADPQTGAFTIELEVKQGRARFANGMFGTAELSSKIKQTSWSVPYESVLDANDNDGFVFITNDNKKAQKQPVVIASFDGKTIRISRGLENTNALIVSGSAYLTDNSPISIIK